MPTANKGGWQPPEDDDAIDIQVRQHYPINIGGEQSEMIKKCGDLSRMVSMILLVSVSVLVVKFE